MRTKCLTLLCNNCPTTIIFTGKDLGEIIEKINKSGWHDMPDGSLCPKCEKKLQEEYEKEKS